MPAVSDETRALIQVSAAMASRRTSALRRALDQARTLGVEVAVEEVILQGYLFLGYPVALNAFALWRDLGVSETSPEREDDPAHWREAGERVCRIVYGAQFDSLQDNIRSLHPDLARWMLVEGYGKVLARPGVELMVRELCIVALLVVLSAPKQLYSHLRGALHAGASAEAVEEALSLAAEYATPSDAQEARSVWAELGGRRTGRPDAAPAALDPALESGS